MDQIDLVLDGIATYVKVAIEAERERDRDAAALSRCALYTSERLRDAQRLIRVGLIRLALTGEPSSAAAHKGASNG